MQFKIWSFLAAAVMVTAAPTTKPPEEYIKLPDFPACELQCMRDSNAFFFIEQMTFTEFCVGENAKQSFLCWVRDELEFCLAARCNYERNGKEIIELWKWHDDLCGPNA